MKLAVVFFVVICLGGVITPCMAEDVGSVQGKVVDAVTGQPLAYANVAIQGTNLGVMTERDGAFLISVVPVGRHEVKVSMIGYETIIDGVQVEPGQTTEISIALTATALDMDEIVVTGTKSPRYLMDVPVRTQVLTRKSIEDGGACTIYDALDGAPGVRVEQQCQGCNFSNVRLQGLGADQTQILVDGQPVYSGLAAVYGLQQIGTASIDRIEVVKGAGSALYGSGAVAGAINLVTRTPKPHPEANLDIEIGEHRTQRYEFSASQRYGDAGIVLYALRTRGDAIDETGDGSSRDEVYNSDNFSDRVRTDLTSGGFNLTIDNVPGLDGFVLKGRALQETRLGGELYNDDYDIPDDVYENPFTPGTERIVSDRYEGEASIGKTLNSSQALNATFAYSRHDRNATNDTFVGDYESINGELPSVDLLRPYLATEHLYSGNVEYRHTLYGKHRLLVGAQMMHDRLDESGMYVVVDGDDPDYGAAFRSTSEKRATDVGFYLQDEASLTDELEVVLGVRFDNHDSKDEFRGSGLVASGDEPSADYQESSFNPRLAVRYDLGGRLTLRGSVGTGFRVPYGFSEDLHLCSGSPRVWKGGDLEPERSRSYSFSADHYSKKLSVGVTLYRVDIDDKVGFIEADEEAAARGYTYRWANIDDAFVQGVELDCRYQLTPEVAIDADLAVGEGEYANARGDWVGTEYEDRSINVSRLPSYTAGIKGEYRSENWTIVADTDLQGPLYIDYFADGEEPTAIKKTETFVLVDAKVARRITSNIELFMGARNLTDYVQEDKRTDDAAFMYAPVYGRILYSGIGLSFN